jgi:hypothetical protein
VTIDLLHLYRDLLCGLGCALVLYGVAQGYRTLRLEDRSVIGRSSSERADNDAVLLRQAVVIAAGVAALAATFGG